MAGRCKFRNRLCLKAWDIRVKLSGGREKREV